MLTIIDYSMGNLHSVGNALDRLGVPYRISASPEALESAGGLILCPVWVRFPMQRKICVLPAWTGHWFLRRGKSLFWASVWGCSFFLKRGWSTAARRAWG